MHNVAKRITYERVGVLVSNSPGYKDEIELSSVHKNLVRVQSLNYGFEHVSTDVKSIGSDDLVKRNGESPVIRHPDVKVDIEYVYSSGENEKSIGLHMNPNYSLLRRFIDKEVMDDVNISIITANQDAYLDVNNVTDESEFEDYYIMGVGNAFLTQYSYNAQVGQVPTARVSFEASNMKFDPYIHGNEPTLASLKLGRDNVASQEKLKLTTNTLSPGFEGDVNALMPGDMDITVIKQAGNSGGVPFESLDAAIQSISIDVPIDRQRIYTLGSNYAFNKKLKLPIIATASISMIVREFEQGDVESFFIQGSVYDIDIKHWDTYFHRGIKEHSNIVNVIQVQNAQLKTKNFSVSIDNHLIVDATFTFGIGRENGLKIYTPYHIYFQGEAIQVLSTEKELVEPESLDEATLGFAEDTGALYVYHDGGWTLYNNDEYIT
jgi:hypothetical protein